jgi:hypothetical protein
MHPVYAKIQLRQEVCYIFNLFILAKKIKAVKPFLIAIPCLMVPEQRQHQQQQRIRNMCLLNTSNTIIYLYIYTINKKEKKVVNNIDFPSSIIKSCSLYGRKNNSYN